MTLELKEFNYDSEVQCRYYYAKSGFYTIGVIKFTGHYRMGSAGNPDANFMHAMIAALLIALYPDGLVIDLSELRYEWGDMLEAILPNEDGTYRDDNCPAVVVVGPESEEAVKSLIDGTGPFVESSANIEWLVDSLDEALSQVLRRVEEIWAKNFQKFSVTK